MTTELLPMLLIKAGNGELTGRTRFQKLMFLYQMEAKSSPLGQFEYFPWDYGPYSKELQEELETLVERGLVEEKPVVLDESTDKKVYQYTLTREGTQALESALNQSSVAAVLIEMRQLFRDWGRRNLDDLIRHVYSEHPEFATRSKLSL